MTAEEYVKTEHELIEMGYRFEKASVQKSIAIRQTFSELLQQYPIYRAQFIYYFNQGRHEARRTK